MNTRILAVTTFAVSAWPLVALFADDLHPIVDFQAGYLLGSSRGKSQWLSSERLTQSKALPGPQKYRVYSMSRYLGEVSGAKAASQGAPCDATQFVNFSPSAETTRFMSGTIAIAGSWNALPRVPRQEDTPSAVYQSAVSQLLKSKGIAKPTVRIAQVLRVDLEGDGVDEVLINATNHLGSNGLSGSISSNSTAGEYSAILLRKIVKGKVQTSLIEGAFYPTSKTFNAPSVFKIMGAFDVNGDGKMEIVTRGRYYEGDWATVYSVGTNNSTSVLKVQNVLSDGCGA